MARVAHNRDALSVRDMVQNQALAKSIHDAAWTQFAAFSPPYKAAWPGRRWVAVDPPYASQDCPGWRSPH